MSVLRGLLVAASLSSAAIAQTPSIPIGPGPGSAGSGGGGSGTVNAGLINQLGWYAGAGTAISGLATANSGVLVTSAGGVPSISSMLPSGLTIPGYQTSLTLPLSGANGGTGVANTGITETFAANFTTTGAGAPTLAFPGSPATYTFPTTAATLARTDAGQTFTGANSFGNITIGAGSAITSSGAGGALGSNAFNSTAYAPLASPTFTGTITGPDSGTWSAAGLSGIAAFSGVNLNVTGATIPTNGLYLSSANTPTIAVNGVLAQTWSASTALFQSSSAGGVTNTTKNTNNGAASTTVFRLGNDTANELIATVNSSGNSSGNGINSSTINGVNGLWLQGNGTNSIAISTSGVPTLTTPILGAATATTINGNTFTTGTYTLTGVAGKTLTFNNTITLAGTDAQTYTLPTTSATIARTDAANTFTGVQTFNSTPQFLTNIQLSSSGVVTWLGGRGIVSSNAAGNVQHGAADAAAPVAQIISFQSVVAGTSNTAGVNTTFTGSASTGSGTSGDFIFQTGGTGAGATAQNAQVTALTIKGATQNLIGASVTDATNATSGALQIAGGMSVTKRVFMAGLTPSSGLQTAVLCLSAGNEIIADSVACLASSERFKQDISPSNIGLAAVLAMQPITYRYALTGNARFDAAPNQRDIHAGFRAEDVARIDRRLVALDGDGAVRTVRQDGIIAAVVRAVQEQQAQINELRAHQ